MSPKSNTFSIYLLKDGISPDVALCSDQNLKLVTGSNLPGEAKLYIISKGLFAPWWKSFLGIREDINQGYPGGILFLPVEGRWFAAMFGYAHHYLNANAYQVDFGLRVTLNAVDEKSLRSTDILNPETARRERVQAPQDSSLDFFSSDEWTSVVLKRISGHVQAPYRDLLSSVTGSDSIRITTKKSADELIVLCQTLLELYKKEGAEQKFPEIFNIRPEKSREILTELDEKLLEAVKIKDDKIILSYPDMQDYQDLGDIKFGRLRKCEFFRIDSFWNTIEDNKLRVLTIHNLKNSYGVRIFKSDGQPLRNAPIPLYRCLIWDCVLGDDTYHFCEGVWYHVASGFVATLKTYLDSYFQYPPVFPSNTKNKELDYNIEVAQNTQDAICMDQKLFRSMGQSPIELCDVFSLVEPDMVELSHVKIGIHSSKLSHLFSQGYVSSRLLLGGDVEAYNKIAELIDESELSEGTKERMKANIHERNVRVRFGIITTKDSALKSDALPLFSRINLHRVVRELKLMRLNVIVELIPDLVERT